MTDSLESLAGRMPDGQVATRLGIEVASVKAWRREHGVPAFQREPPRVAESQVAVAPAVAERPSTKRRLVRRRGDVVEIVVSEPVVETVAPEPVRVVPVAKAPKARMPKRSRSVSARLESFRDRLGRVSDDDIAAEAGVSRSVVGAFRRRHRIAAYGGYLFKPGTRGPRKPRTAAKRTAASSPVIPAQASGSRAGASRIDAFASLVGVLPDADVAAKAAVSRTAVVGWRKRNGIAAARPRRTPSAVKAAQPAVATAPTTTTSLRAFRVVASGGHERREFILAANDLAGACALAEARLASRSGGPWRVEEVRYLGESLASDRVAA